MVDVKLSDDRRWFLVGERRIPVVHAEIVDTPVGKDRPPFRVRRCGVMNEGWALSITWGDCTYSDNYHARLWGDCNPAWNLEGDGLGPFTEEPEHVEVMVMDGPFVDNEPRSYQTADDVLNLIDELERSL